MITRHFADLGGRRVHYRRAGAGPPALLLHESPRSSAALLPLLERLAPEFTVFALDTPGYGQSDPLPLARPDLRDYADGLVAAMDAIGLGRTALYGTHTGASIAFSAAVRHPDRFSVTVLDGFPVFTPLEREEALASYLPPFRPAIDGTHLAWLWSRVRDQTLFFPWYRRGEAARLHKPLPPPEGLHAIALDILRAGDGYRVAYAAAFASRPFPQIREVRSRMVIGAREDDVLLGHLERLPQDRTSAITVARFSAHRDEWAAALRQHLQSEDISPRPTQAGLPADRPGCAYLDLPWGRMHVRGALGGSGIPLVLLHPLPGGSVWFEERIERLAGQRPVLAPDLPGAGDSDPAPDTIADALETAFAALGLAEMELDGEGIGLALARTLHRRDPARRRLARAPRPIAGPAVPDLRPHPAGAHLFAAWHHVRDAIIFGEAPYGTLDADLLHRRTVELLKARGDFAALASSPAETD